jgi:LacI family transcriptional regulator
MPSKQPTLQDIADRVGVSLFTVSRVLNGKHKAKWASKVKQAERIKQVAEEMGYRPNLAARAMQSKRSMLIGVLQRRFESGGTTHPAVAAYLMGIDQTLTAAGYGTVLVDLRAEHQSLAMRERLLDGALVVSQISAAAQQDMLQRFGRVVWIDSPAPAGASCVLRDETAGIGDIVDLVGEIAGLKRVRYIGNSAGDASHYSVAERWDALDAARDRLGVPLDRVVGTLHPERVVTFDRLCRELEPGTCWLCYDAYTAEALYHHAVDRGICAGRDVGLISCDGYQHYPLQWPQLSYLHPDYLALGGEAAHLLLAEIAGEAQPGETRRITSRLRRGTTHLLTGHDRPSPST